MEDPHPLPVVPDGSYRTACRACAHGSCGVIVRVRDGSVASIEGDPADPVSHGYICAKAIASAEMLRHPRRIRRPMMRDGDSWREVSWGEAMEYVASRLLEIRDRYGPEAIAVATGTNRDFNQWIYGFASALGTPTVVNAANECYIPRVTLSRMLIGDLPVVDYEGNPGLVMIWGANPVESNPDEYVYSQLDGALRRGARLVVVDPRRTQLAARADIWLRIRPATDVALALGMAKVIVEEDLYDHKFVEGHSCCFDGFRAHLSGISHAWVEEVTRVARSDYVRAAREYASVKPAALHWGVGVEQNVNAVYADYALLDLVALTGNLDVPGGNVIFDPPPVRPSDSLFPRLPPAQREKTPGREYRMAWEITRPPLYLIWDAVLTGRPYPVRAMLDFASNLLVTRPNSAKVRRALSSLDLLVVADFFMTPTARLAHVVLPAATWLEQDGIADYRKHHGYVSARRRLFRFGEARSDAEILLELGRRMGLPGFRWTRVEEALDEALEPAGLTWEEFLRLGRLRGPVRYRKYVERGFPTPSGRYEFSSGQLAGWGYQSLPVFREPPESPADPEVAREYPMILITGARRLPYMASEGRQLEGLRRLHPYPEVEIHPDAAARIGVSDGDWVAIETRRGRILQRARLNPWLDPQVASAEYGWWYPEIRGDASWRASNVNILTDDSPPLDPLMGATNLRGLMCRIRRAEPGEIPQELLRGVGTAPGILIPDI
ncbi:MAG: molybdopterin-containing oxidoreductase family protein [Conexivisphaera sp.]